MAPRCFESRRIALLTVAAYCVLSAALLWPLPLHLRSALPGDPAGDLGVYVWNLWIFRHELLDHGHLPLSTDHVFAYTGGADFSLHNYTPLAGLVGMPLMGLLGVVGTFNTVLIGCVGLSGFAVHVLARRIGLRQAAAFAAGAVFVAAPVITARETAHFSLVTTGALPLFIWAVLRVLDSRATRDAVLVGVICAVAAYSDAYFGIYCVLMGLFTVAWRFGQVDVTHAPPDRVRRRFIRIFDAIAALALTAALVPVLLRIEALTLGTIRIRFALYTPMLVLALACSVRSWLRWRPRLTIVDEERSIPRLFRLGLIAIGVCTVLMLPSLVGILESAIDGDLPESDIFWRSSPRGVDALSYLVPNPVHPWFGHITSGWFMPHRQDAWPEFIGSFSVLAVGLIVVAAAVRGLPAFWLWFTGLFTALSLGPFIHVAGVNTALPGPWTFLRYVPLVGMARAPSRFAIVAVLGLSILFGHAVEIWLRKTTWRARTGQFLFLAALVFELNPAPRHLFPADVPAVYSLISTDDELSSVLELPTGIRDGMSSIGDFSAESQFFQTKHRHRLVGGYLSRVSGSRKRENRRNPVMRMLTMLSEPSGTADPDLIARARESRNRFLSRTCVGYVVIHKRRASPELQAIAADVLQLVPIHDDADYELLRPVDPPACEPRRRGYRSARAELTTPPIE